MSEARWFGVNAVPLSHLPGLCSNTAPPPSHSYHVTEQDTYKGIQLLGFRKWDSAEGLQKGVEEWGFRKRGFTKGITERDLPSGFSKRGISIKITEMELTIGFSKSGFI